MANHPNRKKPPGREDYVVQQFAFALLEVAKMSKNGPLAEDYDKWRKAAKRAAVRAAHALDRMSPDASSPGTGLPDDVEF